jgi:flagellar assembly factor FliW
LPEGSVISFPEGLPGFETSHRFVLLRDARHEPLLLLQNLEDDKLSLPVIPAQFVDPGYQLVVEAGDCEMLGFHEPPRLGHNVLCLLVLILPAKAKGARCNLFAPIVINPVSLRGKQLMQIGSGYPSLSPLAEG